MKQRRPLPTQAHEDVLTVTTFLADARAKGLELLASNHLHVKDRECAAELLGLIIAALALAKDVQARQEELSDGNGNAQQA